MAFASSGSTSKSPVPPAQGSARPDPLIQPALANAMRYGKMFARMAPPGAPQSQGQDQSQGQPQPFGGGSQNAGNF